jgi:hypothetical protein
MGTRRLVASWQPRSWRAWGIMRMMGSAGTCGQLRRC